jgi:hypothetical protein
MSLTLIGSSRDETLDIFEKANSRRIQVRPYEGVSGISLSCTESLNDQMLLRQWVAVIIKIKGEENLAVITLEDSPVLNVAESRLAEVNAEYPITAAEIEDVLEAARQWFIRRYEDYRCQIGEVMRFVPEKA